MANKRVKINSQSPHAQDTLYLYTKGGQYSLDGKQYIGEYHINGDQAYTGPTISKQARILRRIYPHPDHYVYDQLYQFDVPALQSVDPIPYALSLTTTDYQRGFCQRYFVEKRGGGDLYPIEIDLKQYQRIGQMEGIDGGLYCHTSIEWKLTGTLAAIEQFNVFQLLKGSKQVPNIVYAVRSFSEFGLVTSDPPSLQDRRPIKVQTDLPDLQDVKRAIELFYYGQG